MNWANFLQLSNPWISMSSSLDRTTHRSSARAKTTPRHKGSDAKWCLIPRKVGQCIATSPIWAERRTPKQQRRPSAQRWGTKTSNSVLQRGEIDNPKHKLRPLWRRWKHQITLNPSFRTVRTTPKLQRASALKDHIVYMPRVLEIDFNYDVRVV